MRFFGTWARSPRKLHVVSTSFGAWRASLLAVKAALGMRSGFSVTGRVRSFGFALKGLRTLVRTQHNAWVHVAATVGVVVAGAVLGLGRFEWLAVVVAIVLVWVAEAINTAFEFLCDVASPGFHPVVARAKDVAAAAVLICALGALAIAGLVFGPVVVRLFGSS